MKRTKWGKIVFAIVATVSMVYAQAGKAPSKGASAAKQEHGATMPGDLKWTTIMPGAEMAVIDGDPNKTGGVFTLRLRTADGTKIPPHWHPTDEKVTVLQGTFLAAMGDKYDEKGMMTMPVGSFFNVPKTMHHFATCKGVTIVQVHGEGPFKINWVNPEDDPANKGKAPAKSPAKKS